MECKKTLLQCLQCTCSAISVEFTQTSRRSRTCILVYLMLCLDIMVNVLFQVWPLHGNCEDDFFFSAESRPVSVCLLLQFSFISSTLSYIYDNSTESVRKSFFFRLII